MNIDNDHDEGGPSSGYRGVALGMAGSLEAASIESKRKGLVLTRCGSLAHQFYEAVKELQVGDCVQFDGPWAGGSIRVTAHFIGKRSGRRFKVSQKEGVTTIKRKE
jgi:hypothetical protein